jgi:hypothetical protein
MIEKRIVWNKGLTKETDNRIKELLQKRKEKQLAYWTKEQREKHSKKMKEIPNSGQFKKGQIPYIYGKFKEIPIGQPGTTSYKSLHAFMRRRLPKPELCVICNIRKAKDLANISGGYKRELSDWEWLCRKCHMIKDGRYKKFSLTVIFFNC